MTPGRVGSERYFILLIAITFLIVFSSACEAGSNAEGMDAATDTSEVNSEGRGSELRTQDFQVTIGGSIADTLRGDASFGIVMDPATGKEQLVVKLSTEGDITGGVLIARGNTELPTAGAYDLGNAADPSRTPPDSQFVIIYRKGLDRYLKSAGGNLSLAVANDTLIQGSFEANLRGWIAEGGQLQQDREVRIRGSFTAEARPVGYIIGL